MAAAACPAGLSGTLVLYIIAQFVTWAVHDGLQQYMFEQPGFERFGVTMALCLQARPGPAARQQRPQGGRRDRVAFCVVCASC